MKKLVLWIIFGLSTIFNFVLPLVPYAVAGYFVTCLLSWRFFPDVANIILLVYGISTLGKTLLFYLNAAIRWKD